MISNNRKSLDQCIQSQKLTGNRIAGELKKKMKETDENAKLNDRSQSPIDEKQINIYWNP